MADPARARKIAERTKALVAGFIEHRLKDERLGFITVTDVRVTGDLQHASIFYTVFGDDDERQKTAAALEDWRGRIRSHVGKGLGIRLTPSLEFIPDAIPEGAASIEEALRAARERDEELAKAKTQASYAGDADPYKKPAPTDESADEDATDAPSADVSDAAGAGSRSDAGTEQQTATAGARDQ
ncbi:30S ribosome-binding factor RbfA [Rudaeicoccus suwonensis]|uniref:Ribosome-binding factor A n=1 Tax=Rudaeicoccus suwonensis TaxID=657409 RepID=A0A561E9J8_9MICO|nr:30S ribosome-binding factor RbfA [Rudaeicoccus suwonensis]TWE12294.1 ribosome-binding factor A [Rudaeicoccus suwonensis]